MKKIKNSHQLEEEKLLATKQFAIGRKIEDIQLRYDNKEISYDEYDALYYDALDEKDSLYAISEKENRNAKFNYFNLGILASAITIVVTDLIINKLNKD